MLGRLRSSIETRSFKREVPALMRSLLRKIWRRLRTAIEYHQLQRRLILNRELGRLEGSRERCFIIGNGPSLRRQDLSLLRQETVFVVNSFFLHPDYSKINPAFHCVVDPGFFADTPSALSSLRHLESVAPKTTRFLFLSDAERVLRRHGLFQDRKVHVLLHSEQACDEGKVLGDLSRPISGMNNVVISCLLVACYIGFRRVYLLGCDHDWLATPGQLNHFYGADPYHDDFPELSYEDLLEMTLQMFRGYRHVRDYARLRGIQIFNATPGGFLDVFPRADFESLVAGAASGQSPPVASPGVGGERRS